MSDFYDGITEDTVEKMKRMQPYIDLAMKQGDAIHQERPYQLVIDIRLPKPAKEKT
jgi:hypothetical protein